MNNFSDHLPENEEPENDVAELHRALCLILTLHPVIEIRALRVERRYGRPANYAGFFDNVDDAVEASLALPKCRAAYWTLNRIPPDMLAIRANRLDVADDAGLTSDCHISRRVLLLLDFDPVRPHPQISSTDEEHFMAQELAVAVTAALADDHGWPLPILFDSGNGFGLWYRIALDSDDGGLVKRVLQAMAAQFDTDAVKIDTSVFNPARITKLPGTVARKGDHIPARPHRVARIISQVDSFDEVALLNTDLLRHFADTYAPAAPSPTPTRISSRSRTGSAKASARERCIKYLLKIPDSIEGQHGSDRMFHAACLCIQFDLNEADALEALAVFNSQKCHPAWIEKEIRHKLADATKAVDSAGERGRMMKAAEPAHIRLAKACAGGGQ